MKRTRCGLELTSAGGGLWLTDDGYEVGHVREISMCEHPHPVRHRDESGRLVQGYCYGGEDHDRVFGWGGFDPYGVEVVEPVSTFAEAHELLAAHLRAKSAVSR